MHRKPSFSGETPPVPGYSGVEDADPPQRPHRRRGVIPAVQQGYLPDNCSATPTAREFPAQTPDSGSPPILAYAAPPWAPDNALGATSEPATAPDANTRQHSSLSDAGLPQSSGTRFVVCSCLRFQKGTPDGPLNPAAAPPSAMSWSYPIPQFRVAVTLHAPAIARSAR
ncbi:hypothetical protein C8Q76DRAFT_859103 [Earliella scabrosa]|nr:hypothetical protein C8Q76DRAFT_859103 [Earliella scabrosa]